MGIFKTYFESHSLILLALGLCFTLFCLIYLSKEKEKASLLFLLLASFALFCFGITLDPFLNLWDERFHALVAKNMMDHPFVPTLYDNPIVNMEYDRWDRFHIWLHKQPLFLWQIVLSFKLFGISEFTLRIPNLIMSVGLTYITFRTAKLLSNYKIGIIAGLLICSSNYLFGLVSGDKGMDHNDVSFLFYISLSIWSYVEYYFSKKKHWIFLIGLFSGMAVLCKWVVGLLVYFGWFVVKVKGRQYSFRQIYDFALAFIVSLVVAVPWQVYGFLKFPEESKAIFKSNAEHFYKVIPPHSGTWAFHFERVPEIYGLMGALFLIPSFFIFRRNVKESNIFWFLSSMVLVVYVFFTMAQTKLPSFTIVVFMIMVISLATFYSAALELMISKLKYLKKTIFVVLLFFVFLVNLNIEDLQYKHTTWKREYPDRNLLIQNKEIFKNLDLPDNTVIFNVTGRHYIECMFYTGLPAYNFIPSVEQYYDIVKKGYIIALFTTEGKSLPRYLMNNEKVTIIGEAIRGYE